jgi:serine phosphatase RsbU (regulator of sigma subunit)/anti-sigma regulatory factor (Ser/Thr protein kinase)
MSMIDMKRLSRESVKSSHSIRSHHLGKLVPLNYRLGGSMALKPRFYSPRSIGQRFAMTIGAGAGLILVVLAVANFLNGRELLLQQTSSEALKEVHDEMRSMDELVDRIAMLPYVIGATQTAGGAMNGVTLPWLASLLEYCPIQAVYGLYMVLDGKNWADPASDIWVDRKTWPNGARLKYDFHDPSRDWYHGAKVSGRIHVTQPYFDEGGSEIDMISITKPVYSRQGAFIGVAGVDVALDEMRKIVRKLHIRDFGTDLAAEAGTVNAVSTGPKHAPKELRESAYLISSTGALIVGPEESQDMPSPPSEAPNPGSPDAALEKLIGQGLGTSIPGIKQILASSSGWMRLKDGSGKVIYWAEGKNTGWKLVMEVPYEFIVAPAHTLATQSAAIGGVLLLAVVFYTARRVSGPISELQSVATDLQRGTYEDGTGVLDRIGKRHDELGRFASSFSTMAREIRLREERLSDWNANLERTVRERTADLAQAKEEVEKANRTMAAELAEAATYSRAVLPERLHGPVTTDWVFVTSSQLGGDSFGYHWLDDDRLSLYLLDVCGHGVGAALLSISVVNVLRTTSLSGTDFYDPSSVLARLNEAFPMEKHNDMFFTGWYGVYSRSRRELRYACGGHPPAVLIHAEGDRVHLSAKGAVIGAFPGASYENATVTVPGGSRLYLFSDGTYEIDRPGAPMMTHDEFSAMLAGQQEYGNLSPLVDEIRRAQQSDSFADDFSLVEFYFSDGEVHGGSLKLRADPSELDRLRDFLQAYCVREMLPDSLLFDLEVILEELVSNVIKYGGVQPGSECCSLQLAREGSLLTIRFSDSGIPFNPLARDEVDTDKPIEEREIGGLGVHFIKKLTDSQNYERREGRNNLTLMKSV